MNRSFTLPVLQTMLDNLSEGQRVAIARKAVDNLFGMNDVQAARLLRFADGHNSIIVHADNCVVFEKRPGS